MTRRSLSTLYRAEVRRRGAAVEAGDLLALGAGGDVDPTMLERLAQTPDAPAVLGIARSIAPWSTGVAEDLRRNDGGAAVLNGTRMRMRKFAWVSLAAAASLAVVIGGLVFRGEPAAPTQVLASHDNETAHEANVDVLFADPEGALMSAALEVDSESIFADSLDL